MSAPVRFTEDVRPVSDLKTRSAEILGQLSKTRRPVLITRRGRGVAVLLDVEEYERLVERQEFVAAVEAGAHAVVEGDVHQHGEALEILGSFGKPGG